MGPPQAKARAPLCPQRQARPPAQEGRPALELEQVRPMLRVGARSWGGVDGLPGSLSLLSWLLQPPEDTRLALPSTPPPPPPLPLSPDHIPSSGLGRLSLPCQGPPALGHCDGHSTLVGKTALQMRNCGLWLVSPIPAAVWAPAYVVGGASQRVVGVGRGQALGENWAVSPRGQGGGGWTGGLTVSSFRPK